MKTWIFHLFCLLPLSLSAQLEGEYLFLDQEPHFLIFQDGIATTKIQKEPTHLPIYGKVRGEYWLSLDTLKINFLPYREPIIDCSDVVIRSSGSGRRGDSITLTYLAVDCEINEPIGFPTLLIYDSPSKDSFQLYKGHEEGRIEAKIGRAKSELRMVANAIEYLPQEFVLTPAEADSIFIIAKLTFGRLLVTFHSPTVNYLVLKKRKRFWKLRALETGREFKAWRMNPKWDDKKRLRKAQRIYDKSGL
ncbi:MAG: hypothetical protein AAFR61_07705 [Bacteroidota bacterium]